MTQDSPDHFRADPYANEELVPFDARDYSGKRAMWMLLGLIGVAIIAAVVIFNLYQPGVRDRDAPPQISAENSPYKIEPEDAQGEVTPNQDKEVYDVLNGTAETGEVTNRIEAEEPIKMPDSATVVVEGSEPVSTETTKPAEVEIAAPEPVEVKPVTPPPSRPSPSSSGSDYVVQVASVRTEADANRIWSGVNSKFSTVLPRGTYSDIKRVDLGDKGIYYRLRVAGLSSQDAAKALCDRMKAGDQACFVTKK